MIEFETLNRPKKRPNTFYDTDINSHLEKATKDDIPNDKDALDTINNRKSLKVNPLDQAMINADKFLNSLKADGSI